MFGRFKKYLFIKPEMKIILKQGSGKRARWRWEAYHSDACCAVSPIQGFAFRDGAEFEAEILFSKSFNLSIFEERVREDGEILFIPLS